MRKKWKIPDEFTGIHRYIKAATERDEFRQTCPDHSEIDYAYGGRGKRPKAIR